MRSPRRQVFRRQPPPGPSDDLISVLSHGLDDLSLPSPPTNGAFGVVRAAQMRTIVDGRLDTFNQRGPP
ncbi:hypothetical protein [Rhizobium sp. SG570]|uniref:hypothetical protein n=1 Tax=Rhizobium sp. SG570 TaxID=2587113 RepID=UPI001448580F|nr:hypothetical protein [Rhizobium sp. SG570]NKJ36588.1 hypothetical protein [Rhizobium sp. SG570]